jgi:hypothetical protein
VRGDEVAHHRHDGAVQKFGPGDAGDLLVVRTEAMQEGKALNRAGVGPNPMLPAFAVRQQAQRSVICPRMHRAEEVTRCA